MLIKRHQQYNAVAFYQLIVTSSTRWSLSSERKRFECLHRARCRSLIKYENRLLPCFGAFDLSMIVKRHQQYNAAAFYQPGLIVTTFVAGVAHLQTYFLKS
eukprot:gene20202-7248_t